LQLGAPASGMAPLFSDEYLASELWPAARALVSVLERRDWRRRLQQSGRVVDLGSGTGACGLAAVALGASRVLCTDTPAVLPSLEATVRLNTGSPLSPGSSIACAALDWSEPLPPIVGGADVVLASDCLNSVYGAMAPCLAATIAALLSRAPTHASAVALVAQTQRTADGRTEREFLECCEKEGLLHCELAGRWMSPQGPVRCFALRLPRARQRPAVLWRVGSLSAMLAGAALLASLLAPYCGAGGGGAGQARQWAALRPAAAPGAGCIADSPGAASAWPHARLLSQQPRVYLLRGMLSHAEAEQLVALASGRMLASQLGAAETKSGRPNDAAESPAGSGHALLRSGFRNSSSITLSDADAPLLPALRLRWADAALLPAAMAEPTQLARYSPGEAFGLHLDPDSAGAVPRVATLITYLSDGFEGGETVFPRVEVRSSAAGHAPLPHVSKLVAAGGEALLASELRKGLERYCTPASRVLRVAPRKGDALLFFSSRPDLSLDLDAVHGGCPPRGADKWIAQQWFNLDPAQAVGADAARRDEPAARGAERLTQRAARETLEWLRRGWRGGGSPAAGGEGGGQE